jgi:hypothetical protein
MPGKKGMNRGGSTREEWFPGWWIHRARRGPDTMDIGYLRPMEQTVEIPVTIRGEERIFPAQVQAWRYGLRFLVDVDGVEMTLERDDSGEFRALLPEGFTGKPPHKEVIGAIIEVLQTL